MLVSTFCFLLMTAVLTNCYLLIEVPDFTDFLVIGLLPWSATVLDTFFFLLFFVFCCPPCVILFFVSATDSLAGPWVSDLFEVDNDAEFRFDPGC